MHRETVPKGAALLLSVVVGKGLSAVSVQITTPVSLGIFYTDNETNRRWALKSDDPKVLEEINAVFVTVEPRGERRLAFCRAR